MTGEGGKKSRRRAKEGDKQGKGGQEAGRQRRGEEEERRRLEGGRGYMAVRTDERRGEPNDEWLDRRYIGTLAS